MSFLSFYNDHHGKEGEAIIKHIQSQKWNDADFAARTEPLALGWKRSDPNFFQGGGEGGGPPCTILPIHLACTLNPPPSFLKLAHEIYPAGVSTPETGYGRLPLHIACMYSASHESIQILLQQYMQAAAMADSLGRLPIHYASRDVSMGENNVIETLLNANPKSATTSDLQGFLPIHIACRTGASISTIRLLLRMAPLSVFEKTKKGSTALICAKAMKAQHRDQAVGVIKSHIAMLRQQHQEQQQQQQSGNKNSNKK